MQKNANKHNNARARPRTTTQDVSDVVRAFLDHLHDKKVALPKSMLQVLTADMMSVRARVRAPLRLGAMGGKERKA